MARAFVYVPDPAKRAALVPRLRELFSRTEGIVEVNDGTDAPRLGMPTPTENDGMSQLILYSKAGYAFFAGAAGDVEVGPAVNYGGTHGYPRPIRSSTASSSPPAPASKRASRSSG